MFENILQQMGNLGGSSQQFAQAQQTGQYDQVDPNHAAEYVQSFAQNASPEAQQQVYQDFVRTLSPEQRQALGQAMVQHQGTPVQSVQYDDDQNLAQAMTTSSQALSNPGQSSQGGLGGLFGMFGQMMGGQGQGGMGGMGNLGGQMGQMGGQVPQQQGGMDLGGLLQNPIAKAGLVGLAGIIGSRLLNHQ